MPGDAQYGGQALIEGVMIRGARHVCVACRSAEPEASAQQTEPSLIVRAEVISTTAGRLSRRFRFLRWPFIRGSLVLLESVELGTKGLRLSASVALQSVASRPDGEKSHLVVPTRTSGRMRTFSFAATALGCLFLVAGARMTGAPIGVYVALVILAAALGLIVGRAGQEEDSAAPTLPMGEMAVGATMVLGLALGIGLFFVLPSLAAGAFVRLYSAKWALNLTEGVIRIFLFFAYLAVIARLPNIHRLFQYHGAEHQVIHAYEQGRELTPENAAEFSTIHPRCGTAFMAVVLMISIVVFAVAGWQVWWERVLLRVVLLPVVAGVAYELLKWNSRFPNPVLKALMTPGLWFQKITTQPPSRDQVEVAIAAMKGVLMEESRAAASN